MMPTTSTPQLHNEVFTETKYSPILDFSKKFSPDVKDLKRRWRFSYLSAKQGELKELKDAVEELECNRATWIQRKITRDHKSPESSADWNTIAALVRAGCPLVYLLTVDAGSLALVLHRASESSEVEVHRVDGDNFIEDML
jgi:hypothetical protein